MILLLCIGVEYGTHISWESFEESFDEPLKFGADASETERDHAFDVLGRALRHFYRLHLDSLPTKLRDASEKGDHPSLSHEREAEARIAMTKFEEFLKANCEISIVEGPTLGFYHMDQIIFSVTFDSDLPWKQIDHQIPPHFLGYRILRGRQSEINAVRQNDA